MIVWCKTSEVAAIAIESGQIGTILVTTMLMKLTIESYYLFIYINNDPWEINKKYDLLWENASSRTKIVEGGFPSFRWRSWWAHHVGWFDRSINGN